MSNLINKDTQLDSAYKASQSVGFTDTDKSNFEEQHSFNHLIDAVDVFVDEISYNNPDAAVAAFVVASGLVQLTDDITSGDGFRVYYLSGITNIIHPKKYGNNYAPIFYDGSMNEIYDGDLYKYATVDWKNAYISIERNAVTDTWHDPLYFDGFWYTGKTLADITLGGGGGGSGVVVRDEGNLVNANALTLNFVGTNVTATNAGGGTVNVTVGGATASDITNLQNEINILSGSMGNVSNALLLQASGTLQSEINTSGQVLIARDIILQNEINTLSGNLSNYATITYVNNVSGYLQNQINNIPIQSGVATQEQLLQTSGDISNRLISSGSILWASDVVLQNNLNTSGQVLLTTIANAGGTSGGVTQSQLLQTSGDIVAQISFNSGGVTNSQLLQTSGDISSALNSSGQLLLSRDTALQNQINSLSGNLNTSGSILWARDAVIQNNLNASGQVLLYAISQISGGVGSVTQSQLLQTSGDIINQITFNSGGVTNSQLLQTSGVLQTEINLLSINDSTMQSQLNYQAINILNLQANYYAILYSQVAINSQFNSLSGYVYNSVNTLNQEVLAVSGELNNLQSEINTLSGQLDLTIDRKRSGKIYGDAFSGSPLNYTVTFPPFVDSNYSIQLTSNMNRLFYFGAYTSGQFSVYSSSERAMTSTNEIHWTANKF
jgi:hypothetical protein